MRIAILSPNAPPRVTGPVLAIQRLGVRLAAKGHTVACLTRRDGADPWGPGIESPGRMDPIRLAHWLRSWKPDLIWCHEVRNLLTRYSARWARRNGVRLAIQPHGGLTAIAYLPGRWRRFPYELHDLLLGPGGVPDRDREWVASSAMEESGMRQVLGPRARIHRAYLGCDAMDAPNVSNARPRVFTLANFGAFRDPRWVHGAVARLSSAGTPVDVAFAGPRQGQSFLGGGASRRWFRRPEYLGRVTEERKRAEYARSDLFCYPSRYESFGLPCLEASVAGLPLVASGHGIVAEIQPTDSPLRIQAPTTPAVFAALQGALPDLAVHRDTARGFAARIGAWAAWDIRLRAYAAWIEGGSTTPDPPPMLASTSA